MKKVKGQVDFSVTVECPECGHTFDATEDDSDRVVTDPLFNVHEHGGWENLQVELMCSECECDFELEDLEY